MGTRIFLGEFYRGYLLDRFLSYVRVDTRSDGESKTSPSTAKQRDLALVLEKELQELGCLQVEVDKFAYTYAKIPPTKGCEKIPCLGLLAHIDSYFGVRGDDIKPMVVHDYLGTDLYLPDDPNNLLLVESNPHLLDCIGKTVITAGGDTVLAADDKAGVAEIMTMVKWLRDNPEFPHGEISICFTPDEEVGRGTEHFDTKKFGAKYAYTFDSEGPDHLEVETFSADAGTLTIKGKDTHPGFAMGKMVSAVEVMGALLETLPQEKKPRTTDGRQPYLFPYDVKGDTSEVTMKFLFRAFTVEELRQMEEYLQEVVMAEMQKSFPGVKLDLVVTETYRNMKEVIQNHPIVTEIAKKAIMTQGMDPKMKAIRGGTDGSKISFMGIPCPNIGGGGQNFHSTQEWVCLEEMIASAEVGLQIVKLFHDTYYC